MEIVKTHIDEKTNKELFKSANILFSVVAFFGALLIGYYVGFSIVSKKWDDVLNIVLCAVGAIFIVIALVFTISISKAIKTSSKNPMDTVSDFQEEFVLAQAFKGEEKIGESKIYYNTAKQYMVKKNFIFIQLQNNSILAFTKSDELDEFLKTKIAKRTR